jgi:ER lumen protein retaining receptor
MNIFRFVADLSHLLSILILIYNIRNKRSSSGISFKSQCLYTVVFVTRYLGTPLHDINKTDLFWSWVSLYNTAMKIFFIVSSAYILYLMKFPFRPTHDTHIDTFKVEFLLLGSFVAAMVFNYEYSLAEVRILSYGLT